MCSKLAPIWLGLLAGASLAGAAQAQSVGEVLQASAAPGSVLVLRSNETYSLAVGDALFEGDRVVTRTNGAARLSAFGCIIDLASSSLVFINAETCETAPVVLSGAELSGTLGAPAEGEGLIGGAPLVLGLVGGGGAAAAAANGGGSTFTTAGASP
jgi:hypothetical protein